MFSKQTCAVNLREDSVIAVMSRISNSHHADRSACPQFQTEAIDRTTMEMTTGISHSQHEQSGRRSDRCCRLRRRSAVSPY